jgi:hypothetical protein
MEILLWMAVAMYGIRLELQRGRKLATTTGGEPVHADAGDTILGTIHALDFSIASRGMQAGLKSLSENHLHKSKP